MCSSEDDTDTAACTTQHALDEELLGVKRRRAFLASPAAAPKDLLAVALELLGTTEADEHSPLGHALSMRKRARAFGALPPSTGPAGSAYPEAAPAHRGRSDSDGRPEGDFVPPSSEGGPRLRLGHMPRPEPTRASLPGLTQQELDNLAALFDEGTAGEEPRDAQPDTPSSPIGAALRCIARARAFAGEQQARAVASQMQLSIAAACATGDWDAEADGLSQDELDLLSIFHGAGEKQVVEEDAKLATTGSPQPLEDDEALHRLRRCRAFAGDEAARELSADLQEKAPSQAPAQWSVTQEELDALCVEQDEAAAAAEAKAAAEANEEPKTPKSFKSRPSRVVASPSTGSDCVPSPARSIPSPHHGGA